MAKHIHRFATRLVNHGNQRVTVMRCTGCPRLMVQTFPHEQSDHSEAGKQRRREASAAVRKELER